MSMREATPENALEQDFYQRDVVTVARDLIGTTLAALIEDRKISGMIVETEAYGDQCDLASHAAFRRNGVVRAMWGEPGTLYVYRAFGMYPCFNVVTGQAGTPSAVLIRAMCVQFPEPDDRIASGPGRLGRFIGLNAEHNEHRLHEAPFWIESGTPGDLEIATGPRVGVNRGDDRSWRFALRGHPAVSRPRI
jgi:DNA-3-methyladenine glycosylase